MILGADKTRLSKRHGATSVMAYEEMGYLPDALVNYLVRLGWSHGDQEVFSREELIRFFSFENVGNAAAVFNPEKLLWLNHQYIMAAAPGRLAEQVIPFLTKQDIIAEGQALDMAWLARAVKTLQERAKTLVELASSLRYYIAEEIEFQEKAKEKFLNEKSLPLLKDLKDAVAACADFSHEGLEPVFRAVVEKHGVKLGAVAQPVRVAMTGGTESPGIYEVLEVLGKEKTLRRLERAILSIG
jgi:glutamyl-tRNA synthetase